MLILSTPRMMNWTERFPNTTDYAVLTSWMGGGETSSVSPSIGYSTTVYYHTFWVPPVDITVTNYGVGVAADSWGSGETSTFTMRDDGANTSVAVTFTDTGNLYQSWSGSVSVSAGSTLDIIHTRSGTISAGYASMTIYYTID